MSQEQAAYRQDGKFAGLNGKVAIVTGSSKGIGQELACALGSAGASVIVNYKHDQGGAEETRSRIETAGGTALVVQADVGVPDEARELVDTAYKEFGKLDVLVNNAARTRFGPALEATQEDFDDVVNTNMRGTFFTSVTAAKRMIDTDARGSIINFSSCSVALQIMWHSVYTMSKGGIEGLTAQLAVEWAPNVRVNAIAPAPTQVARALIYDPHLNDNWSPYMPMGRVALPQDYVGPLLFLASDQSGFMTGEVLHIDGGWSLRGAHPSMAEIDLSTERVHAPPD